MFPWKITLYYSPSAHYLLSTVHRGLQVFTHLIFITPCRVDSIPVLQTVNRNREVKKVPQGHVTTGSRSQDLKADTWLQLPETQSTIKSSPYWPPRSRDNRVQEPGFESRHLASASRDSKYNKEFTLLKRLLNEELQNHLQRELSYSPEGSGWGTHVYLWRIHFDIWQN